MFASNSWSQAGAFSRSIGLDAGCRVPSPVNKKLLSHQKKRGSTLERILQMSRRTRLMQLSRRASTAVAPGDDWYYCVPEQVQLVTLGQVTP